jgi:small subunit ribosomal protein S9
VTENDQEDPRNDEETAVPEPETPEQPEAEAPEAAQPEAEAPAAPEPAAEAPAEPEPEAEAPAAPEPEAEAPAAPEPEATPEPAAEAPAQPVAEQPAAAAPADEASGDDEDVELAPRLKPEIPGADLIPDLVADGDQFLDAEAQAAAEAEAEAAALRAREESDDEDAKPIADAAIDLAAGARYTATGKRKTAVARVILKPGTGTYLINDKPLDAFFPRETLQRMIRQPLEAVGYESRMDVVARMHGGGVSAQAGALRHGVSRALIVADPNLRGELKRRGFLTRDPRVKERKKAGLKKARKRPQFSKR